MTRSGSLIYTDSMDTNPTPLRDLLAPLLPVEVSGFGQWAWLAGKLSVDRRTLDSWLRSGAVPSRRVDAVCALLKAPSEVREELRRRAGFQVLSPVAEIQGGV